MQAWFLLDWDARVHNNITHKNEEKNFRIAATLIAPSGEALDKANVISIYYISFGIDKSLANIIMRNQWCST